jgi:hypothetical protein
MFLILQTALNGCKVLIKLVVLGGVIYYLYNIKFLNLLYPFVPKSIKKIDLGKLKRFFYKKPKKFPFIIRESLNDDIPIEIIIDNQDINYLRFKKYGTLTISIATWMINKLSKENLKDDPSNKLKDSIIMECLNNGWFKTE